MFSDDDGDDVFEGIGVWSSSDAVEVTYEAYVNTRDCLTVSEPLSGMSILVIPQRADDGPEARPEGTPLNKWPEKCIEWLRRAGFYSS